MSQGQIIAIYVAATAGALMQSVHDARLVVGRGIEGDRYFNGWGTYSNNPGTGREVTLIETEAIEALGREYGIEIDAALARRNVITRGVALNHLVEKEFAVGAVILRGMRLCEPCAYLERLSAKGVMRGLIHRGGLRAEVASDGVIYVNDKLIALDD